MMPPVTDFSALTVKKKLVANFKAVQYRQSNGEVLADSAMFIAGRNYRVIGAREVHGVAGTDVGAVTLMLKKMTGTQAPAAGANLMSAGWNLKAAANTPQNASLVGTAATLALAAGDRLGVALTGTPTAVAGVIVVVELEILQQA
jgi:hypothetical protein